MREKAFVINFEGKYVWVAPLITDACINCDHPACAKKGTPFLASNPGHLPVTCGDIVRITSPLKSHMLQGFMSLLFPVAAAITGYVLTAPIAQVLNITRSEGMKATGVLAGLALASALVYLINSRFLHLAKPEITEIMAKAATTSQARDC